MMNQTINLKNDLYNNNFYNTTNSTWPPETQTFNPITTVNYNASNETEIDGTCGEVMVPSFFLVIVLVGFVGNLFVMLTVAMNKSMRNTTNILIFNLALADMFFILICVPATGLLYMVSRWPLGLFMCRLSHYLIHVTAHVSIDTLVFMSFDRYLAVVHPISSITLRNTKNALIAVVLLWIAVLILNAPIFADYVLLEFGEDLICMNESIMTKTYPKIFYGTFFLFGLVFPLLIIIVLYTLMVHRLLKMGRNINGRKTAKDKRQSKDGLIDGGDFRRKSSSENMRSKRRVMKMVIIVVVLFVVCWLPIHICFLLQFFVLDDIKEFFICVRVFCNCLAYANSCINPILYAFLSESFRSNFKKLCSIICFGRFACLDEKKPYITEGRAGRICCEKTTVLSSFIEMKPIKKEEAAKNEKEASEKKEESVSVMKKKAGNEATSEVMNEI